MGNKMRYYFIAYMYTDKSWHSTMYKNCVLSVDNLTLDGIIDLIKEDIDAKDLVIISMKDLDYDEYMMLSGNPKPNLL